MSHKAPAAGFCRGDARHDDGGARRHTVLEGPGAMVDAVVRALRKVHDPEIPVNIFDLGLIYKVAVDDEGDVAVDMTLTAPSCPVAGIMPLMVRNAIGQVEGVGLIAVTMVWDPPWTLDHLSDEARLELGLF